MRIILGLGSNVGDRLNNLKNAVNALDFLNLQSVSSIYENSALLPANSPKEWDLPFLNMAVLGDTTDDFNTVLGKIKRIEQMLGRDIAAPRWSPRIIDIDILLADIINVVDTCWVPHKEFLNRPFALIPAQEIAGEMVHPGVGKQLKDIFIAPADLILTSYKINS